MVFTIGQRVLPAFCEMRLLWSKGLMFWSLVRPGVVRSCIKEMRRIHLGRRALRTLRSQQEL